MAVPWCRIVLRVELEVIGEERGGVLKTGIAAIGDYRGLVDEELTDGIEGRCELCDQLWSDCGVVGAYRQSHWSFVSLAGTKNVRARKSVVLLDFEL